MNMSSIMQHIKSGNFDRFYIFYGDEAYTQKLYINKISEKSGLGMIYADSFSEIMGNLKEKSLFHNPYIYVILDDKDFLTNEKAWDISVPLIKDDIVVMQYTSCDKRLKFWKKFQDLAVEFPKMGEDVIIKHINKEISLPEDDCKRIIEACDGDFNRILLEIDKVKNYCKANNLSPKSAIKGLFSDGTIYMQPKDAIFDFVNAVLDRDSKLAFDLLMQSYAVGEANMVLMSVLYNSVRTLLLVQSEKKNLGLNSWAVKNVLPYKGNYRDGELVKFMSLIRNAERGIKTGEMSDNISVQSILVQIM